LTDTGNDWADHWRASIRADTSGRYHLEMGVAILRREENVAAALEHFQRAVSFHPGLAEAQVLLLDTLARTNRAEEAAAVARAAAAADPDYRLHGLCWQLVRALRDEEPDRAATLLDAARSLPAGVPDVLAAMDALVRLEHGEVPGTLLGGAAAPRRPADLWPAIGEAFVSLGQACVRKANPACAEEAFRCAIAADETPDAHAGLARVLRDRGDLDGAKDHYERAFALAPYNLNHPFELAGVLAKMEGRLDEAVAAYRAVLNLDPAHAASEGGLRRALLMSGRIAEAVAEVRKALEKTPRARVLMKELGLYLHVGGDLEGAIAQFQAVRAAFPDEIGLHVYEALICLALGRGDAAHAHIETALVVLPDDPRVQCTQGLFHLHRGDAAAADRLCRQALERARRPDADGAVPSLTWSLIASGLAAGAVGDDARADALLREAADQDAGQVWIICQLHAAFRDTLTALYTRLGFTTSRFWLTPKT